MFSLVVLNHGIMSELVVATVNLRNTHRVVPYTLSANDLLHLAPDVFGTGQDVDAATTEVVLVGDYIFAAAVEGGV